MDPLPNVCGGGGRVGVFRVDLCWSTANMIVRILAIGV